MIIMVEMDGFGSIGYRIGMAVFYFLTVPLMFWQAYKKWKKYLSPNTEFTSKSQDIPIKMPQVNDSLTGWAIWALAFSSLSVTLVGGAIGGLLAGGISFPIAKALLTRSDGRKLPKEISIILIAVTIIIFIVGHQQLMTR